ncbi:twin transmembrane helix small protein [Zoogloea sp. LCSB751]|uniref:twin transmembrane helix small protein n=1 Tax=Zoogloea sp. LCSB751 TaxID=1965277 RepID=UPI000B496A8F|nr:twin transmembrane helix small protein [Zoogloea sp. LCSB751]
MAFKLAVVFMLLLVVGSLFSGLFFLYRDKGNGDRVVRALTLRVYLSLVLFLGLLLAWHFGAVGR